MDFTGKEADVNSERTEKLPGTRHHKGRDNLAGEYRWGDLGQLILLALFLIIWISDSFIYGFSILSQHVPLYIRLVVSGIFLAVSGYLAQSGLKIVFGEERQSPSVIKKSVFGIVRHPVYLGSILLYLGLAVSTLSAASLCFLIIIFIFYNYIAGHEEKLLEKKFGKEYLEYKKIVPKWIPRITGKK